MFDKVDAIVLFSKVNRFYYTKIETSHGCAIISDKRKIFITDFRYIQTARKNLEGWDVIQLSGSLIACVVEQLKALEVKTVGYEEEYLSVAQFLKLRESLCGDFALTADLFDSKVGTFELIGVSKDIATVRSIKTEDEISKIAAAQIVAQKALNKAMNILKPGITEREFATEILYEMQQLGAEGASFDTIVAFKENSAMPHYQTGNRKLEKNDLILVDMGARMNGYCSDMTRTFTMGSVEARLEELHSIVLEGQLNVLKHIKAGMTCAEADTMVREFFKANGYEKEFGHSLGHGVGIEVHEMPQLSSSNNAILQPNMVVTIEPGLYIEGIGGVRIEDMIVINENGCLNLTKMSKSLNL